MLDNKLVDLTPFPSFESYNVTRYSKRYEDRALSQMTKSELEALLKKTEKKQKDLEEELEQLAATPNSRRSYVLDEQFEANEKMLIRIKKALSEVKSKKNE